MIYIFTEATRDFLIFNPCCEYFSHICFILALEIIPRQLCDNAGFDATNILNKLRQKHAQGNVWYGVDIMNEDISDNYEVCKIQYLCYQYLILVLLIRVI